MRMLSRLLSHAVTGVLLCGAVTAAEQPEPASIGFNIEAQPMQAALNAFAHQSGYQLLFQSEVARDLKAPRVVGTLTPQAALGQLLLNTGLQFHFINARTVAIRSDKTKPAVNNKVSDTARGVLEESLLLAHVNEAEGAAADAEAQIGRASETAKKRGDNVEEMVVEDSRIKPFSSANVDISRTMDDVQPYYIFDSKTIEKSAALNVEDFLKRRLTMNTMASTTSQQTSNVSFSQNQSQIDLRGLGVDKTLVLINGRRIAGADLSFLGSGYYASQPDLNAIPLGAIERIEVMPSSASGIYGGSALGGVVNVILKQNYTGGETRVSYDNTWDNDSPNRTIAANYGTGFNGGKTRIQLNAQWGDSEPMLMQDRRQLFERGLATVLRNNPSMIYSPTTPFQGALPNVVSAPQFINGSIVYPNLVLKNGTVLSSSITYIPAGTAPNTPMANLYPALIANAGKYNLDLPASTQPPTGLLRYLSAPSDTSSVMMSVRQQLSQNVDVTLDVARRVNKSNFPLASFGSSNTVSAASPINPFNMDVTVYFPDTGSYPVTSKATSDSLTLSFGAKMFHNWMMQADYTWSKNKTAGAYTTGVNLTNMGADLTAGRINPFVDVAQYPGSINVMNYFRSSFINFNTFQTDVALRGSGPLMQLPWGAPNLTFGIEHRAGRTPENTYGALLGANSRVSDGILVFFERRQATSSAYVETLIPLVEKNKTPFLNSLELQLSARSERYIIDSGTRGKRLSVVDGSLLSYIGPTADNLPTASTRPFDAQDVYTSNNHTIGFKYQPLQQVALRMSRSTAFVPPVPYQLIKNAVPDSSNSTVTDPRTGVTRSVQTISGGNPDLTPQNSKSWNMGVIWEPASRGLRNLRLNAEYYRIDQFDVISSLGAQAIVNSEGLYSGRVTRDAAGLITFVDNSLLNLFKRETSGWDLNLDYRLQTAFGDFSLHASESIILDLSNQVAFSIPSVDYVGYPRDGGAAKYKSGMTLDWNGRHWSAGWATVYFGSYYLSKNLSATDRDFVAQGSNIIPSQMYHDVYVGYTNARSGEQKSWSSRMLSGITVQAGIKNVLNKTPPFDVRYDFYLSPYGDLRLRNYWISARKSF